MGTNFSNNDQQEALIEEYEHFLKLEKSLSKNTIDAYRSDLQKLINFLKLDGIGLLDATLDDLQPPACTMWVFMLVRKHESSRASSRFITF